MDISTWIGMLPSGGFGRPVFVVRAPVAPPPPLGGILINAGDVPDPEMYLPVWSAVATALDLSPRPAHALPLGPVAAGVALGGWPVGYPVEVRAPGGNLAVRDEIPVDGEIVFAAPGRWRVSVDEDWNLGPERSTETIIEVT